MVCNRARYKDKSYSQKAQERGVYSVGYGLRKYRHAYHYFFTIRPNLYIPLLLTYSNNNLYIPLFQTRTFIYPQFEHNLYIPSL